jgi:hypothetical protein
MSQYINNNPKTKNMNSNGHPSLDVFPITKNIPSKYLHINRNKYNHIPTTTLISMEGSDSHDENGGSIVRIFKEEGTKHIWYLLPWYKSIFHNPIKNVKLICYDFHVFPNGVGSSEIIVNKKSIIKKSTHCEIPPNAIQEGSYNYRDLHICGSFKHCVADIFPSMMYCKCIGK